MKSFRRSTARQATRVSSDTPLTKPMGVILHIGTGKTGTSSVQFFLRDNREQLGKLGCLYPQTPGRARHSRLGLFVKPDAELKSSPEWTRQKQPDPATFRSTFRRQLVSEIEDSGLSRILFSDEILFGASYPSLRRLRRFTDRIAKDLRLVVYLRRQDDHMVSRYQQGVKIGWVQRLDEWATEDMSDLYDYRARLRRHEQILAPDEFVVRRYEPSGFAGGSLFQDFLDAVGIDALAEDLAQVPNRNESLDAESVEFLRLLNLHRFHGRSATPGLIDNRHLVKHLAEVSTGPTLTLPSAFLDDFMAQWEGSNQRVASDFLGDASGQLFHMPRKTAGTTTEQRLDPTRLEHFFDVLELPEQLHGPLRALAEREAKAR